MVEITLGVREWGRKDSALPLQPLEFKKKKGESSKGLQRSSRGQEVELGRMAPEAKRRERLMR